MRTFVAEFFYSSLLMREFIIADNQDISKAGMMFLLSKQKEVSLLFYLPTIKKSNDYVIL